MSFIIHLFSRRWIFTTLLVMAGVAVLARLGIWQLDRLDQRREFNARVLAQVDQPPLELTGPGLQNHLYNMEYREVIVTGKYDFDHQIAIRNQYWENQWGAHLVTPLIIGGNDSVSANKGAILVDRGWIPSEDFESGDWAKFDEQGTVTVKGVIRRSRDKADFGSRSDPTPVPGSAMLTTWNFVNIEQINRQTPYRLPLVYVQQAPDSSWTKLPYRSQPELELSEGPHMGYAIQWFAFAAILGMGYPFFIQRQGDRQKKTPRS